LQVVFFHQPSTVNEQPTTINEQLFKIFNFALSFSLYALVLFFTFFQQQSIISNLVFSLYSLFYFLSTFDFYPATFFSSSMEGKAAL
tara:strand:+ start:41616 stop:41876 length:261 start_codon:yes stop_codon:yes gene_type:complete